MDIMYVKALRSNSVPHSGVDANVASHQPGLESIQEKYLWNPEKRERENRKAVWQPSC